MHITVVSRCAVVLCLILTLALTLAPAADAAKKKHVKRAPAPPTYSEANPKYSSLVIDGRTGQILSQSNPDRRVYPASLTKMMTLTLVFDALSTGRASLNDQVMVSQHAQSMAPSKLGLRAGTSIRLEDAIYAVVTKSANDIAVALGEHIAGSEDAFAGMMNRKAQQLGMRNSHFENACGLHNTGQMTTARDMTKLAQALIYSYPQYYHYFATQSFSYKGMRIGNHNHLMETYSGMDGIKTGYIGPSGFNLVASAKRGNQRLIGAVFGGSSARSRDAHMATLLDAGFGKRPEVLVANVGIPLPGRKAETGAPASDPTEAARWAALAPMLQGKAVGRVIGDGTQGQVATQTQTQVQPPEPATRTLAKVERLSLNNISPASGFLTGSGPVSAAIARPVQAATLTSDPRNWAVQIGAYSSRVKTDQSLQSAQRRLPPTLAHGTAVIAPLKTEAGWLFRARLNGFSMAEASQVCSVLSECLTIGPDANQ